MSNDEKDAQIQRMNAWIGDAMTTLQSQKAEIGHLNAEIKEMDLGMKDATRKIIDQMAELSKNKQLITELADALDKAWLGSLDGEQIARLLRRAREATK